MPLLFISLPASIFYIVPSSAAVIGILHFVINGVFLKICNKYLGNITSILRNTVLLSIYAVITPLITMYIIESLELPILRYLGQGYGRYMVISLLIISLLNFFTLIGSLKDNKFKFLIIVLSIIINLPYLFID